MNIPIGITRGNTKPTVNGFTWHKPRNECIEYSEDDIWDMLSDSIMAEHDNPYYHTLISMNIFYMFFQQTF